MSHCLEGFINIGKQKRRWNYAKYDVGKAIDNSLTSVTDEYLAKLLLDAYFSKCSTLADVKAFIGNDWPRPRIKSNRQCVIRISRLPDGLCAADSTKDVTNKQQYKSKTYRGADKFDISPEDHEKTNELGIKVDTEVAGIIAKDSTVKAKTERIEDDEGEEDSLHSLDGESEGRKEVAAAVNDFGKGRKEITILPTVKRPRGRPKGSKTKPKVEKTPNRCNAPFSADVDLAERRKSEKDEKKRKRGNVAAVDECSEEEEDEGGEDDNDDEDGGFSDNNNDDDRDHEWEPAKRGRPCKGQKKSLDPKEFPCSLCGEMTECMSAHMQKKHKKPEERVPCPHPGCDQKVFKLQLKRHALSHEPGVCPYEDCKMQFKSKNSVYHHVSQGDPQIEVPTLPSRGFSF